MSQYLLSLIVSLGLFFASTSTSSSSGKASKKKTTSSLEILKTDGGQEGWIEGGL